MFSKILLLVLLLVPVNSYKTINVNKNNIIKISGEIDERMVTRFLTKLEDRKHIDNLYVYLDTSGGSVDDGMKIMREILKYNISCIAEKAYSMGFVILQACNKRYITEYASVMQHQMYFGVIDEHYRVNSYMEYINQVSNTLDNLQSERIGLHVVVFRRKITNNWWLFSNNIIKENCADEIVSINYM